MPARLAGSTWLPATVQVPSSFAIVGVGGMSFTSGLAAASAGVDFEFDTTATRVAGTLFKVATADTYKLLVAWDSGSAAYKVYTGSGVALAVQSSIQATGAVVVNNDTQIAASGGVISRGAAASGMVIKGNWTAGGAGADVATDSTVTRTNGLLLSVKNNGVQKFEIQYHGLPAFFGPTQTTVGAAGAAAALPANPTGYMEIQIGGLSYVIPYYAKT